MSVKRFSELFDGLDRVHGKYDIDHDLSSRKEKVTGKAVTVRAPVTIDLYAKHINGEQGLGIVPIRDDQNCMFGAIDIDEYDITLEELSKEIQEKHLPLVLCRTKSGGAHCYMFFTEPCKAEIVRDRLEKCAAALGHPGVEIFPKQKKIRENDVGNWINLPYFDADSGNTPRYAFDKNGKPIMDLDAFVEFAEAARIDKEMLRDLDPPPVNLPFSDGPPCLQRLVSAGKVGEGSRNDTLMQMGVYTRYKFGDDWGEELEKMNHKYFDPFLPAGEVEQVKKSLQKKEYAYMCEKPPFCNVCVKDVCLSRKFGVGSGGDDGGAELESLLGGLRRSVTYDFDGKIIDEDEVIWFMDVNGHEVQFSTKELMSQQSVLAKLAERTGKFPLPVRPPRWNAILKSKIESSGIIEFPPETSFFGSVVQELRNFITSSLSVDSREDVMSGKAYKEDGVIYWRSDSFRKYLVSAGIIKATEDTKKIHRILEKIGAGRKQLNLNPQENIVKQVWFIESLETAKLPKAKEPEANY